MFLIQAWCVHGILINAFRAPLFRDLHLISLVPHLFQAALGEDSLALHKLAAGGNVKGLAQLWRSGGGTSTPARRNQRDDMQVD